MSDLLFELFSEEIPAKMQVPAAKQMLEYIEEKIKNSSLDYLETKFYVTPRRITITITGLPSQLAEKNIEKKGPKIDARPEALEGFLSSVDMKLEELNIIDGFYYAKKLQPARSTSSIIKNILEQMLISFTWPKSMRSAQSNVKCVRPLRNIMCLFDNKILPIKFDNLIANNKSFGHRFMANYEIEINSIAEYLTKMRESYVILSHDERKQIIIEQASKIVNTLNLKAVLDENLLNEVTGLVEYPHALLGKINQEFISLPKEVLVTAMKVHQRYFYLEDDNQKIAPYFLTISNVDLGNDEIIIAGNERVLKARFSDAKFFWEEDLKQPSSESLAKLAQMTFHSKLGTMFDKVTRIISLAEFIAKDLYDINLTKKAALLCKTDLVSKMVGEFPELQGIIGKYYAIESAEEEEVATAISEHYRPISSDDNGDISLLGAIIAIADKLDTIVGLWIANEKPTSSKDPFALRRSALGIIKLIRHHKLSLSLSELIDQTVKNYDLSFQNKEELITFFNERLKYYLKGENFRHDLIMSSLNCNTDNINEAIIRLVKLQEFTNNPQASNLLFAIKRVLSILADSKIKTSNDVKQELLTSVELSLYEQIMKSEANLDSLLNLVNPINKFFDEVLINDPNLELKQNRLNLLNNIATLSNKIADFSMIEV